GSGRAWPTSKRSAKVRKVLTVMSEIFTSDVLGSGLLVGIPAAQPVHENGGEEQEADDDVDVIRADGPQIEDVGHAGDDQQAEGATDRVADPAAQDRVAADHQRSVHLELEAEAGSPGGAAQLADEQDAAEAGTQRAEQQRA